MSHHVRLGVLAAPFALVPALALAQPAPKPAQPAPKPASSAPSAAQTPAASSSATTPGSRPDVYRVHFAKAAPGQADALGKSALSASEDAPEPGHRIVLRHQEGDDWDYCVIDHLGQKATIDAAPGPSSPATAMRSWHEDTYAAGPAWQEFSRQMALAGGEAKAGSGPVYIVSVYRAVPGHFDQLEKTFAPAASAAKVEVGNVLLQHIEGGAWQLMTIARYNSWQDLAADRASTISPTDTGWADVRQHASFHRDTIADRLR